MSDEAAEGPTWRQVVAASNAEMARLEALEAVAVAARRAVDAIDAKPWAEASPVVAELNDALTALGGSPTEDPT